MGINLLNALGRGETLCLPGPDQSTSRVLDVGCAEFKIPGAIGIDKSPSAGVDVLHDLDEYPWPFPDSRFDMVLCRHSLAHLKDVVRAMEEIHRITRANGEVLIVTPHFSSDNAFTDITSEHFFGYRSLDYFCRNGTVPYRYSTCLYEKLGWRISFRQAVVFPDQKSLFNPFQILGLEWLVNRFPRAYEHFWAFVVRANEVSFRLRVIKVGN